MQFPVLVKTISATRHEAWVIGLPNIREVASTQEEALAKAKGAIERLLSSGDLILVSVPSKEKANPWLRLFGRSAEDPDFDEFVQEMRRLRSEDRSN